MKANARRAYNALKKAGAPVFIRDDGPNSAHFHVSGEEGGKSENWVDYWNEAAARWGGDTVNPKLTEILAEHGLFGEWETAGSVAVWDA